MGQCRLLQLILAELPCGKILSTPTENHLQPENSTCEEKEILSANINENVIPDLEVGEPAAEITVKESEADAIKDDVKEEVFDDPTKELEVEVNKSMKNYLNLSCSNLLSFSLSLPIQYPCYKLCTFDSLLSSNPSPSSV